MTTVRGARIIGTLRRTGNGKGAVRMEELYDTGVDDLWSALTEPSRLARWVADVDGDLHPGGRFHARFTSGWDGPGRVDACRAPHHLALTMAPGTAEETVIQATLTAGQHQTRLVIEERGIPLGELAGHGAGWQAHIEDLTAHVQGRPAADWTARWTTLTPAYTDLATHC